MARIKIEMPTEYGFTTNIPVRIGDVNYGGHVGNDAITSIIHEARMQYLSSIGCTELDAYGVGMIMADLAVVYKGEGYYGDHFDVAVTAKELSSMGFELFYRITTERNGQTMLIAEAKTGMICFDYNVRKVARLPEMLQQHLI